MDSRLIMPAFLVLSLLFWIGIPVSSGQIFKDNGVNCFTSCMTCFMTGMKCSPKSFPSGSEFCQKEECFISPERLPGNNDEGIVSSLFNCRKRTEAESALDQCLIDDLIQWYPEKYPQFLRLNETRRFHFMWENSSFFWKVCCGTCTFYCDIFHFSLLSIKLYGRAGERVTCPPNLWYPPPPILLCAPTHTTPS